MNQNSVNPDPLVGFVIGNNSHDACFCAKFDGDVSFSHSEALSTITDTTQPGSKPPAKPSVGHGHGSNINLKTNKCWPAGKQPGLDFFGIKEACHNSTELSRASSQGHDSQRTDETSQSTPSNVFEELSEDMRPRVSVSHAVHEYEERLKSLEDSRSSIRSTSKSPAQRMRCATVNHAIPSSGAPVLAAPVTVTPAEMDASFGNLSQGSLRSSSNHSDDSGSKCTSRRTGDRKAMSKSLEGSRRSIRSGSNIPSRKTRSADTNSAFPSFGAPTATPAKPGELNTSLGSLSRESHRSCSSNSSSGSRRTDKKISKSKSDKRDKFWEDSFAKISNDDEEFLRGGTTHSTRQLQQEPDQRPAVGRNKSTPLTAMAITISKCPSSTPGEKKVHKIKVAENGKLDPETARKLIERHLKKTSKQSNPAATPAEGGEADKEKIKKKSSRSRSKSKDVEAKSKDVEAKSKDVEAKSKDAEKSSSSKSKDRTRSKSRGKSKDSQDKEDPAAAADRPKSRGRRRDRSKSSGRATSDDLSKMPDMDSFKNNDKTLSTHISSTKKSSTSAASTTTSSLSSRQESKSRSKNDDSGKSSTKKGRERSKSHSKTKITFYSIEELREKKIPGLDYAKSEKYLSALDFEKLLGCSREAFADLPTHKQQQLKKAAGIL